MAGVGAGIGRVLALGLLPVALATGVWRLERDHPLWWPPWHRPGWRAVSAGAPPPATPAAFPRLVLAVHYPWYGTPDGPTGRWRHWDHPRLQLPRGRILGYHDPRRTTAAGRQDLGATDTPAAGPYDSRDPAVIDTQLRLARRAGLDGLAVSWWGRESPEAAALPLLFRAARDAGLLVVPYYETGELWRRGAAGVAADLAALLERHAAEPAWLRIDGAPVVFLYAAHRLRPAAWDAVRARLAAAGRRLYLVADAPRPEWLDRHPGWLERFDALHVYTPIGFLAAGRDLAATYADLAVRARAAGRSFVPAVAPGFDDRVIRVPGTLVPRRGGATYEATWRAALAVAPAAILVASWNEWHEGSEIEPSLEHGARYLDATREWARRFREGAPWPAGSPARYPGSAGRRAAVRRQNRQPASPGQHAVPVGRRQLDREIAPGARLA